jgi:hypothetical protein
MREPVDHDRRHGKETQKEDLHPASPIDASMTTLGTTTIATRTEKKSLFARRRDIRHSLGVGPLVHELEAEPTLDTQVPVGH